jgi:hypothetical protein
MNALLPMIGAGIAVALLVLLAAKLGFRGVPQLAGSAEARQIAASLRGGFDAADVVLDREKRGALLADTRGRVAVVAPFGAHFIARELAPHAVIERHDFVLGITTDGLQVRLDLGDVAHAWQARLTAAGATG